MSPMVFVALGVFGIILFLAARARELFCLSVRDGRVLVVRGRIPGTLLSDIRDVVGQPLVRRATILAVKEEGGARLVMSGDIDEGRKQRLRNTFHLYPLANLRAAPPVKRPTIGQILGIAWLAWLLDRR
jgi:hypothetical protein